MNRFFPKTSYSSDFVQQALNELKELTVKLDKLEALRPSDAGKNAHACIMGGIDKIHRVVNNTTAEKNNKEDIAEPLEQKPPRIF